MARLLLRPKVATILVVVFASLGLLVMHGLPIHESRTTTRRSAAVPAQPNLIDMSRVDHSSPQMPAHLHDLLGCLCLAAVGLALFATRDSSRVRGSHRDAFGVLLNMLAIAQRAPPSSVRLSLVGVSRR